MRDFRAQPARTTVGRRPAKSNKTFRTSSVRAAAPRAPRTPSGRSEGIERVFTRLLQLGLVLLVLAALTGGLALYLLPKFFTLTEDATVLWVPSRDQVTTQASTLLHVSPQRHHLVVASVQPTVVLDQPSSLQGLNVAQAFYTLQDQGVEPELLLSTLGLAIGHAVDEVKVVPMSSPSQPVVNHEDLNEYLWQALKTEAGPLSLAEKLQWYFFVNSLAKSQAVDVMIDQAGEWPTFYQAVTLPSELKTCTLAVLNASGVNGVATRTSRVLENTDLTVISITDTPQVATHTTLIEAGDNPACTLVAKIIHHLLPVAAPTQLNSAVTTEYRADMVLSIGEDLAKVLSTPTPDSN